MKKCLLLPHRSLMRDSSGENVEASINFRIVSDYQRLGKEKLWN